MKINCNLNLVIISLIAGFCCFGNASQDEAKPVAQEQDSLESQVAKLEQRVDLLERIVFSSAKLSTMEAQRQLTEATARLKDSKQLHLRGIITDVQLQQDRFRFDEAKKALELAKSEIRQNELVGELELLEARRNLQFAKEQLLYSQTLANRGYATRTEVEANQRRVDIATQTYENAKTKLEAAQELEAIKDK